MASKQPTPQEALKQQVFAERLVQQPAVLEYFLVLDEINLQAIKMLLRYGDFVDRFLFKIIAEVAGSLTHGRTVFEKLEASADQTDSEVFKSLSEVRFLEHGIALFNLASVRKDRVEDRFELIQNTRFARLVYEDLLTLFRAKTAQYCALSHVYADVHSRLPRASVPEAHRLAVQLAEIHTALEDIENDVGIAREDLYHVVLAINEFWDRYLVTRDKIVLPYLRVAYKEARNRATTEEQVTENFQNGAQGLIRAVSCYNTSRKINFSSYSRWWVKQAILLRLKEDSNLVKLPAAMWQAHTAIQRVRNDSSEESESELEKLVAKKTKLSVPKIRAVQDVVKASQLFSLDYPIDDNTATLSQVLGVDPEFTQPDEKTDAHDRLRGLSELQRVIVALHYGIFTILVDRAPLSSSEKLVERLRQKLTAVRQKHRM